MNAKQINYLKTATILIFIVAFGPRLVGLNLYGKWLELTLYIICAVMFFVLVINLLKKK
jgi:hypothetical protein